jgi:hypothetical protein
LFAIDRLHLHLITYRWSFYCNRRVQWSGRLLLGFSL